jgi:hypothetical protein
MLYHKGHGGRRTEGTGAALLAVVAALAVVCLKIPVHAQAQPLTVKAQIAADAKSPWEKGIQPIDAASYYNAIECGKQSGTPACVFWDTGICKNPDFEIAMYTPYKSVAYEVWRVVSQKQPPPQPNYAEAQRTRITVGVTPVRGAKNVLTDVVLKRGGKAVAPTARSLATGRFTFDFPAFAPTAPVALDLVGKDRTISCAIDAATLRRMR